MSKRMRAVSRRRYSKEGDGDIKGNTRGRGGRYAPEKRTRGVNRVAALGGMVGQRKT